MKTKPSSLKVLAAALLCSAGLAYAACCQDNGSTVGCDGTRNFLMVCNIGSGGFPYFSIEFCTGSSPGTTYPDTTGDNATGLSGVDPKIALCSSTVTFTGTCCGGAVTQAGAWGVYGYSKCSGGPCPS